MPTRTTLTMVRAFIMVKTTAGKSAELRENIADVEGVTEAHVVAGQYDLIVEATGEEVYDVIHNVATDVRDLDGVVDTRTYICLE
jgi:DNA-binding Lrp family transcriptional regulator